jgi:DNA repair exonuclease SbcCD ATPase subunit
MDVTKAQFVEIEACLLKQDEENRHMFDEIIKILEIVKRSTQEYDDDIERLKEENTILSLQVDKMTALYKKIQVDLKKQQKILEKREEQLKKLESLFNALQSESKTTT